MSSLPTWFNDQQVPVRAHYLVKNEEFTAGVLHKINHSLLGLSRIVRDAHCRVLLDTVAACITTGRRGPEKSGEMSYFSHLAEVHSIQELSAHAPKSFDVA
jgi:hypothetical protein